MERQQESIRVVAKSSLTWWERERKLVRVELSEMLVILDRMKLPSVKRVQETSGVSFSIKQRQVEELRKKLKI